MSASKLVFSTIALVVAAYIVAFLIFLMFWILPHVILADALCLEKGFPKASVTYSGRMYCLSLDGSVRVLVEEVK